MKVLKHCPVKGLPCEKNCAWYVEASGDSDIDGCSMLVIAKAIKHFDKWGIVKWDGGKL